MVLGYLYERWEVGGDRSTGIQLARADFVDFAWMSDSTNGMGMWFIDKISKLG